MEVYFDNAATTPVRPEALAVLCDGELYGNPSSSHKPGRRARQAMDTAAKSIARTINCASDELYFTSGGTEANNIALTGYLTRSAPRGGHIITSMTEHDSVLRTLECVARSDKWDVTFLSPDKQTGAINTEDVIAALREDTVLVSVMLVNNETGAINPVSEISRKLQGRAKAVLHSDCVQALGKVPFDVRSLGAGLITLSGHKIGGPKGVGALYIRHGVKMASITYGGAQERGLRPGTENVTGICAFGVCADLAMSELEQTRKNVTALREHIITRLKAEVQDSVVICPNGSGFILNVSFPGYKSEVLMNYLESCGIYVSKSAACKRGAMSYVLRSMDLPRRVLEGAIRLSFTGSNTIAQGDYFVDTLKDGLSQILRV